MIFILTPKPDNYNTDAKLQAEWWQMMISLINLDDRLAAYGTVIHAAHKYMEPKWRHSP